MDPSRPVSGPNDSRAERSSIDEELGSASAATTFGDDYRLEQDITDAFSAFAVKEARETRGLPYAPATLASPRMLKRPKARHGKIASRVIEAVNLGLLPAIPGLAAANIGVALGWPRYPVLGVLVPALILGGWVVGRASRSIPRLAAIAVRPANLINAARTERTVYSVQPHSEVGDQFEPLRVEFTHKASWRLWLRGASFDLATGNVVHRGVVKGPVEHCRRGFRSRERYVAHKHLGWQLFDAYTQLDVVPRGTVVIDVAGRPFRPRVTWSWYDRNLPFRPAVRTLWPSQSWFEFATDTIGRTPKTRSSDIAPGDPADHPLDSLIERPGVTIRAPRDDLAEAAYALLEQKTRRARTRWDWEGQKPALQERLQQCTYLLGKIVVFKGAIADSEEISSAELANIKSQLAERGLLGNAPLPCGETLDWAKRILESLLDELCQETRELLSESQPEAWAAESPLEALVTEIRTLRNATASLEIVVMPKGVHFTKSWLLADHDERQKGTLSNYLAANVLSLDGTKLYVFLPEEDLCGDQRLSRHELDHPVHHRLPAPLRKKIDEVHQRQLRGGKLPREYSARRTESWVTKIEFFDGRYEVDEMPGALWLKENDSEIYDLAVEVYGRDPAAG